MAKIEYSTVGSAKAAVVLNMCLKKGLSMSASKLGKLMIMIKGRLLAQSGKFFFIENIEYRNGNLMVRAINKDYSEKIDEVTEPLWEMFDLRENEKQIAEEVISQYGDKEAEAFDNLEPMQKMAQYCKKYKRIYVPVAIIREAFKGDICDEAEKEEIE